MYLRIPNVKFPSWPPEGTAITPPSFLCAHLPFWVPKITAGEAMNTQRTCSRIKAEKRCATVLSSTHFSSLIPSPEPQPTAPGLPATLQGPVCSRDSQGSYALTNFHVPTSPPPSIYSPLCPALHLPAKGGTQSGGVREGKRSNQVERVSELLGHEFERGQGELKTKGV